MENLSHSRHPNMLSREACNVFGGFNASRAEDYREIFGGFNASRASSIPVLDLPEVDEAEVYFDVRSSGLDYSDVFGGFDVSDFAVSYEDLFGQSTGLSAADCSSDEAWTPAETESYSGEMYHSGDDPCFSIEDPYQTFSGSTEFNISYHKAGQNTKEDLSNGLSQMTQVQAIPGYTFLVDQTGSLPEAVSKSASFAMTEDIKHNTECNGAKHFRKVVPHSSHPSDGRQMFGIDFGSQREYATDCHHSKDFVTISKISLQTEPSHLPPPSRPPPSLDIRKEDSSIPTSDMTASDNSPPFFDVEVDATSSAAVSAAAMKEAMKKAQAKMKIAKELMERKKEGLLDKRSAEEKNGRCSFSSHGSDKVDSADEWKEATQFFELVRTDKHKMVVEQTNVEQFLEQHAEGLLCGQTENREAIETYEQEDENAKATNSVWQECELGEELKVAEVVFDLEESNGKPKAARNKLRLKEHEKVNGAATVEKCERFTDVQQKFGFEQARKNKKSEHKLKEVDVRRENEKKCRDSLNTENHEIKPPVLFNQENIEKRSQEASRRNEKKKLKEARERAENEKILIQALQQLEDKKILENSLEQEDEENKLKETHEWVQRKVPEREKDEKKLIEAHARQENEKRLKVAREWEETERKHRKACELEENKKKLKETRAKEENEKRLKDARAREENEKSVNEAREIEQNEKKLKEARERNENERRQREAYEIEENVKRLKADREREENEKKLKEAREWEEMERRRQKQAREIEENVKRLKEAREREANEKKLKEAREREEAERRQEEACDLEENVKRLKEALEREENEKKSKEAHEKEETERRQRKARKIEDNEKRLKEAHEREENERRLKEALEREENEKRLKEAHEREENAKKLKEAREREEHEKTLKEAREREEHEKRLKEAHERQANEKRLKEAHDREVNEMRQAEAQERADNEKKQKDACEMEENEKRWKDALLQEGNAKKQNEDKKRDDIERRLKESYGGNEVDKRVEDFLEQDNYSKILKNDLDRKESEDSERKPVFEDERQLKTDQPAVFERRGNLHKIDKQVNRKHDTVRKDKDLNETRIIEGNESEKVKREKELEQEHLRKIAKEIEREKEREKDRMAVDRATLEARESAHGKVEKATAEARQRVLAEARERLEKACAEAREKSLPDKTIMEARVRAERAAVERATAETRERAALGARERAERSFSDKFSGYGRNGGIRHSSSSSDLQNLHFQNVGSSVGSRNLNSSVSGDEASCYAETCDGNKGESAQRCRARLERHRRTAERAAKALAEKNMRDLLAQKEQTERNRLSETLDAEVKRWASGKEGNLRALLSTLQYILGSDSGWHPIPLTEVITNPAVKKAYRKATLCVHPDKLQQRGANIHQKYICEKVFDLLKEAWNKFNSEER